MVLNSKRETQKGKTPAKKPAEEKQD